MRAAVLGGLLAAALALAAAASAAPRLALFPTPLTQLPGPPPFPPPGTALPNVFRPHISSSEVVTVGIDHSGRVTSVTALQRLELHQKADYRLTVPAPATDVVAGPGSESQPGLRPDAILWQGFSPGRRVLVARAILQPRRAAVVLPLRLELSGGRLRLENTTATTVDTFSGGASPQQVERILRALRGDPQGLSLGQAVYVKVRGEVRSARVTVVAPLRVTVLAGDLTHFVVASFVLGRRPRTISVNSDEIEVTAEPAVPRSLLRPPPGLAPRSLLDYAIKGSLTLARLRQYDAPLANPDPTGPARARYVYRTVAAPAPPPGPPSSGGSGGVGAGLWALIAAACAAAAGGLAVLWAHS